MTKKRATSPFWADGENKDFGKVAVEYAAGEDVVLDQQLTQYECLVDQAHVVMLFKQGIIKEKIAKAILWGLEEIKALDHQGQFALKKGLEDVHSNVEQYLIEKLGLEIGGWLRLGIARNDQVYTDTRMWMRDHILRLTQYLVDLIIGLSDVARKHTQTVMPGYTHLRISQPISYGHWLTAKGYHFLDDLSNILRTYDFVNSCPLGIFEMAGTHLSIDRELTAKLLGFERVTPNSLYSANQRGELEAKLLADLSLLALHVRRTMTEIIIFSSHEFQLLEIDDLYTTGGTAQPNLKNPDTLEVVRANMARMLGTFVETMMVMDSLPSGFNRDTQQTKPILFKTVSLMEKTLPVVTGILTSLEPNLERMEKVANLNFSVAPDLSVQLAVKGGLSFREAYKVVKQLIKGGHTKENFSELTPELVTQVAQKVLGKKLVVTREELDEVLTARASVLAHTSKGGPAPSEVEKMTQDLSAQTEYIQRGVDEKKEHLEESYRRLVREVREVFK